MTSANLQWATACAAAIALLSAHVSAVGQERPKATAQAAAKGETPKSPPAAVRQFRDAVAFQDRGVYDLATDEWRKFLERFPADPLVPKARHYLGVCQLLDKKPAEAAATFEQVLREHPQSELADASYLNLGLTQYSLAQDGQAEAYDQAAATLGTLVEKFPKSKEVPEALYYRGEALYARGQKEAAAAAYRQLIDEHADSPRRAESLYALGVTLQELGQTRPAATTFDAFLKKYPKHPLYAEVVMRRAEASFTDGDFPAAEKGFSLAAVSKEFAHADLAAMRQAASLVAQKKSAEAAALFSAIPSRFPQSAQKTAALVAAGNNYFAIGQWDSAAQAFGAVAKLDDPLAVEAAHGLARTHLKRRQPAEALAVVEAARQRAKGGPLEPQLLLDRADALYELPKERGEAVAAYAELASKFPDDKVAPQAAYMAAFTALEQGKYAAAANYGQAFLEKFPDNPLAVDVRYLGAEAALQQKQYVAAADAYRELLAKFPEHADRTTWSVRLALTLYLDAKFADVVTVLEPMAAQLNPPKLASEGRFLLGSAQSELGQYDAAIVALKSSLEAEPSGARADEALLALSTAYRQKNELKEAITALRKLTTELPNSTRLERAYLLLGDYGAQAGDFAAAAGDYQHLLSTWPQSGLASHALFGLAGTQLGQQDFQAAESTLTRFLEQYPQDPSTGKARYARAVARERRQQFAPALEDLNTLLAANPPAGEQLDARYLQGLCFVGLQRWEPATNAFREVLKADPKFGSADKVLYELAWALKSSGKPAEAIAVFRQLAEDHAQSDLAAESNYHLGEAAYEAKEFSRAAEHYQVAQDKAGRNELGEKAAHKRGWALYQGNELVPAVAAFQRQLADFPSGPLAADAQFMLGESLFSQKQYAAAVAAYEQARARPSSNSAFQALGYLHAGQALAQQMDWEGSLKLLDEAIARLANSAYLPELHYEAGWALQNLGKPDDARARYELVVAQTDREVAARARFMIGEILFEKRDYKEAIRNFFKVAYGYGYPEAPAPVQVWQANASYEAARCFEVLKMIDQARKSYREVVEKYPQSDKMPLARTRLEALGS